MKDISSQIANAIYNLAQPRQFDYFELLVSIFGVCISGIAIIFAVGVPKKIAEQQNKINLFKERFEIYNRLNDWFTYIMTYFEVCGDDDSEDAYELFKEYFVKKFGSESKFSLKYKIEILQDKCNLLFDDISQDIFQKTIGSLADLLDDDLDKNELNKIITKWLSFQGDINLNLTKMQKILKVS